MEEKNKKKKKEKKEEEKRMDKLQGWERTNNIKNKKSWEMLPQYFHNKF